MKIKSYRMITKQNLITTPSATSNKTRINKFQEKSNWEPPINLINPSVQDTIKNIDQATSKIIKTALSGNKLMPEPLNDHNHDSNYTYEPLITDFFRSINNKDKNNLTREQTTALYELKNNKEIVIKPADKGGATVILDTEAYIHEALRQLENRTYYVQYLKP